MSQKLPSGIAGVLLSLLLFSPRVLLYISSDSRCVCLFVVLKVKLALVIHKLILHEQSSCRIVTNINEVSTACYRCCFVRISRSVLTASLDMVATITCTHVKTLETMSTYFILGGSVLSYTGAETSLSQALGYNGDS